MRVSDVGHEFPVTPREYKYTIGDVLDTTECRSNAFAHIGEREPSVIPIGHASICGASRVTCCFELCGTEDAR